MIKAGIIGGAGYAAGELIRVLLTHPAVKISFVMSNSHAGQPLYAVHKDLIGDTDINFSKEPAEADVVFLCLGHGNSKTFLEEHAFSADTKIIDLSQDFRIRAASHDFIYGLPELNREAIKLANKVANPGCFATGIELALLPLAAQGLLKDEVHINAITGSTGAGQNPSATSHFSWRNNNISIYKAFEHQHLAEIKQSLIQNEGIVPEINLIPVRGNFTRGIFSSIYTKTDATIETLKDLYKNFYADHPFTIVADDPISLKEVVSTNKCLLQVEKYQNKVLITSAVDNLLKGASGQAVQNMNLMFGLEETAGLKLKAVGF